MSTPKAIKETIADRLKMVREKSGLSTNRFAEILEMSQPAWSRLENKQAEPRSKTIIALIEKFGVDPFWLLTGKPTHVIQSPTALKIGQLADTLPESLQQILLTLVQREALLEIMLKEKMSNEDMP
jgi:transcriptional regulator with XRE-family HTH domain